MPKLSRWLKRPAFSLLGLSSRNQIECPWLTFCIWSVTMISSPGHDTCRDTIPSKLPLLDAPIDSPTDMRLLPVHPDMVLWYSGKTNASVQCDGKGQWIGGTVVRTLDKQQERGSFSSQCNVSPLQKPGKAEIWNS